MSRKQAIVSSSLTAASVAVKLAAAWSGFGATAPKVLKKGRSVDTELPFWFK